MKTILTPNQQKFYYAAFTDENIYKYASFNGVEIFQLADVHSKATTETKPVHKQWCDEITFVYGGKGTICQNDNEFPISKGQIHICFENDMHRVISSNESPLKFYCIGYKLEESNPLYQLSNNVREKLSDLSPVINDKYNIRTAFQTLFSLMYTETRDRVTEHIITNTLNYILSSIFMSYLNMGQTDIKDISSKEGLVFYIISYLRSNIYDINALKNLPDEVGYSYSYLSHIFSKKMGQSLREFFNELRMTVANELLCEKSVTEVSDILGYSSIHAFSKAYKNYYSNSPKNINA